MRIMSIFSFKKYKTIYLKFINIQVKLIYSLLISNIFISSIYGCTRTVYLGSENVVITGRTMDWREDLQSNLWVFPRGIERNGMAGSQSITWVSKYGSLVTSAYDIGTVDGINEKGLAANLLYLVESNYGKADDKQHTISVSIWTQYVLDNFASVAEAVEAFSQNLIRVMPLVLENGIPAQVHLSISDSTGDSAIFEYIDGNLVIHHGKQYQVMTNSPKFDHQLALNTYWEEINGLIFMPGTNKAADRFVRASFLINAIPKKIAPQYKNAVIEGKYINQAIASVMGIMRSVSVPLGITTSDQPNISSTLWRTITDHKNKIYYFDSSTSPNVFWISLANLDFKKGAPVKKLIISKGQVFSGEVSEHFVPEKPFKFSSTQ